MPSRWHTVLVYFGLREDRKVEAELNAAPLNTWRAVALVTAMYLGLGLAFGTLWLVGIDFTLRTLLTASLFLGVASIGSVLATRR